MNPTAERALILEPGSPKPDSEIGKIVASHLGMHPTDAVGRVRYGGGILISRGPSEVVEEVARELRANGVRARVVAPEVLENLPRGYRSTRLEILEEALCARLVGEKELVILHSDLGGIQIHALPVEPRPEEEEPEVSGKKKRSPASTRPAGQAPIELGQESQVSPRGKKILEWIRERDGPPPRLVLTLYAKDPIGPVRLEREEIDFSPLGDLKRSHSLDNFLILVEILVDLSPNLLNRERVVRFLQKLDPSEILYFKDEERQNFDRWVQAWIRLQNAAEDTDKRTPNTEQSK